MSHSQSTAPAGPRRQLNVFDATCIIVGIIIGAGIFRSTPMIAANVPNLWAFLACWAFGGLLSLVGALCYAELVTTYPRSGGAYIFLTRAYGSPLGFVFAWSELFVVRPGSIGAMAYVFGDYANQAVYRLPLPSGYEAFGSMVYAVAAVLVLTVINVVGVREGKWTQNLLTVLKVLGLGAIILAGLALFGKAATPMTQPVYRVEAETPGEAEAAPADLLEGNPPPAAESIGPVPEETSTRPGGLPPYSLALALILVMYTFGGWDEMAYVGAELKDPKRTVLRALLLGTLSVTAIYILVSLAFVSALGFQGVRDSSAVAADVMDLWLGPYASKAIALLICVSALGAINGQIFTGGRILYAMGKDHRLFGWLGKWHPWMGTPVWALATLMAVTLTLVAAVGFLTGEEEHAGNDAAIAEQAFEPGEEGYAGSDAADPEQGLEGGTEENTTNDVPNLERAFEKMVIFTAPPFWAFFFLVGASVYVLRIREPKTPRPYRVTGYPVTPAIFGGICLFMFYSSLTYSYSVGSREGLWAVGLLIVGVVVAGLQWVLGRSRATPANGS